MQDPKNYKGTSADNFERASWNVFSYPSVESFGHSNWEDGRDVNFKRMCQVMHLSNSIFTPLFKSRRAIFKFTRACPPKFEAFRKDLLAKCTQIPTIQKIDLKIPSFNFYPVLFIINSFCQSKFEIWMSSLMLRLPAPAKIMNTKKLWKAVYYQAVLFLSNRKCKTMVNTST